MATVIHPLATTSETRLKLVNPRAVDIELLLEPWGETFPMPAGAAFDIIAEGPANGEIEVTFDEDSITVWAWAGFTVRLFHDGSEMGMSGHSSVPVPSMPTHTISARDSDSSTESQDL